MSQTTDDARTLRREWPGALSAMIARYGDIDLAETVVSDAFDTAARRWPDAPPPTGWILATAQDRALALVGDLGRGDPPPDSPSSAGADPRAGLLFACCHPAMPEAARVALVLRLLGGLSVAEIADAFMVSESTMRHRLDRAKARLRDHHLPYRNPEPDEWSPRLTCVLAVVHLIFTEGYLSPRSSAGSRRDLAGEAICIGRILVDLFPDEPEARGLLALMLLIDARRDARIGEDGTLVALNAQDRGRWHRGEIDDGLFLLRQCQRFDRPGQYQLLAAVQSVHATAESADDTDWPQVLALYDRLLALAPSDEVALDRTVAVAETHGPDAALDAVERLDLDTHMFHAVRADLLTRLGRDEEADRAWTAAVSRVRSETERADLRDQLHL